jgi:thiosulfate/3-mercaptopyruvate sulfurtransferase
VEPAALKDKESMTNEPHIPLFVPVDWLAERLNDPAVRVVDVRWYLTEQGRGEAEYAESHIPGAVYMNIDTDLSAPRGAGPGRHPLPSPQAFAEAAGRAGIGAETHVVAYDQVGGAYAARLWWLLHYFGHGRVSVLDGGWPAWVAAGYPVEHGSSRVPPAVFVPQPQSGMVVDAEQVEQLRHQQDVLLLDARAAERYEGRTEPVDARAGHIPGARSAPYAGNVGPDGAMLGPDDLRRRFDDLGAAQAATIVCYCGSGVTAAHNVLALQQAGYHGAVLYEGSWSDWSSDPARPAATGSEPGGENS